MDDSDGVDEVEGRIRDSLTWPPKVETRPAVTGDVELRDEEDPDDDQ